MLYSLVLNQMYFGGVKSCPTIRKNILQIWQVQ